jgi:hypothetical protein
MYVPEVAVWVWLTDETLVVVVVVVREEDRACIFAITVL